MNQIRERPARPHLGWGEGITRINPGVVAHCTRLVLGSMLWCKAIILLACRDHIRQGVAQQCGTSYAACVAANSAARFGDRKHPRRTARLTARFFMPAIQRGMPAIQSMVVRAGSPSGLPDSLGSGSPTRHVPPPVWRGAVVSPTTGDCHEQEPHSRRARADL